MSSEILGVDEAGRGAWAGPVVAAAVFWCGRCPIRGGLGDSKMLSPEKRSVIYEEIQAKEQEGKLVVGVGVISHKVIDTVGIREANRQAMQEALRELINNLGNIDHTKTSLLIDGRDNYQFDIPGLPKPEYIVRGDSKIKQIMAASILAKVTRDMLMCEYEKAFPGYGFTQHKGYGTRVHQKALQELGICEIHRKSYKPIAILER